MLSASPLRANRLYVNSAMEGGKTVDAAVDRVSSYWFQGVQDAFPIGLVLAFFGIGFYRLWYQFSFYNLLFRRRGHGDWWVRRSGRWGDRAAGFAGVQAGFTVDAVFLGPLHCTDGFQATLLARSLFSACRLGRYRPARRNGLVGGGHWFLFLERFVLASILLTCRRRNSYARSPRHGCLDPVVRP